MAFETKMAIPQFQAELLSNSPFSVLGKTMSELDGLIDQRRGDAYVKSLAPETMNDPQALYGAINQAPTIQSRALLSNSLSNMTEMKNLELLAEKSRMENALIPSKIQTANLEVQKTQSEIDKNKADVLTKEVAIVDREKEKDMAKIDRTAIAKSDLSTYDSAISTIDKLRKHKGLEAGTGASSVFNFIPGTDQKDFSAVVEQLKSENFLAGIKNMKGMGALSDAEGAKIASAIGNLDTGQSTEQFKESLNTIFNTFEAGKQRTQEQYKDVLNPEKVNEQNAQPNTEKKVVGRSKTKDGQTILFYSDGSYGQ